MSEKYPQYVYDYDEEYHWLIVTEVNEDGYNPSMIVADFRDDVLGAKLTKILNQLQAFCAA